MGHDLRIEQVLPFFHREAGQLSRERPGHVPALDEVDDLLACAHRRKRPLPEPEPSVSTEQQRDHPKARVSDDIPHQAQLELGGQAGLLSGAGGPCRDELGDALQVFAGVFQDLPKPLGRHAFGRLGRRTLRRLRPGRFVRRLRSAGNLVEERVEDKLRRQRGFRGFQSREGAQFPVFAEVEGTAQEVPIPLRLRRDF